MKSPAWYEPYAGLPAVVEVLFWCILAITASSLLSVAVLRINAGRVRRRSMPEADESEFLWVFMVPALNEEVTIADSVARLRAVQATHKVILVIDDGSDDRTPEVLQGLAGPDLSVLRRDLPEARRGKAAALNAAWRHTHDVVLAQGARTWTTDRVVIVVVDADGRLSVDAPQHFARHFVDERMAGVQSRVRIYNRRGWLTWAQDVEFAVFGGVYQLGRTAWGTANMGGNGQANRLAALDDVAVDEGPWRHRLTEDQDIGVRLLQAGWRGAQEMNATVEQQGVSSLRRLYRQRTRWAQGAWEAVGLIGGSGRAKVSSAARVDMAYYLITPVLQLLTGSALVGAVLLAVVKSRVWLRLSGFDFLMLRWSRVAPSMLLRPRPEVDS
ncbi:glycosyltransferase [Flexivirga oryzae]|uniref:Cellulose synthase/poly-beta-1,6-N-acetylglucosamine synthase-like glycosyltransferase n=1 Tax=Flexivirga oryzae TaxID=1794944 RepID=A0A839N3E6_9MICO|nr:cellulose synthase/poly-beta-1,6-N-acetylglucosamine synthase-like glycosyltransferase [Flexivirga oryzae]